MRFLPIQFWTYFKNEEYGELNSFEVLDLIQGYLNQKGFNYIKRKNKVIVFHKADGLSLFDTKSFLFSGVVKAIEKNGNLTIINGNWMVFLIALPFILGILIADSNFSTLDKNDLGIIWGAFFLLFGGNLIIRIIAHFNFKLTIKELIKKNYTQHRL